MTVGERPVERAVEAGQNIAATAATAGSRRDRVRAWVAAVPEAGPGVFLPRSRVIGMVWVAVTAPLSALAGLFVSGESSYLVGWVLVSGLYTGPAAVLMWMVLQRVGRGDRDFWRRWAVGLAFCYGFGLSVLAFALTGNQVFTVPAVLSLALGTLAFTVALVAMMRDRSGSRQIWVDFCQSAMLVLGIVALVVPPFGADIVTSDARWFVIPAVVTACTLLAAFSWSLRLVTRLGGGSRSVEEVGAAVALTGSMSAAAQVAQGLSDFTLPSAPLFALQATCMGLLLLIPLHQPKRGAVGLDRLPPQAQVRSGGFDALIAVILLVMLFVECVAFEDVAPWGYAWFAAVASTQLVFASAQYTLAVHETKRLYARVETAAIERKRLLEEMLRGLDRDRYRVASQLHEHTIASYVSLAALVRERSADGAADGSLRYLADELKDQAEDLRRLMLAVKPIEVSSGSVRLAPPAAAYFHSLFGDEPAPTLDIAVDPDLELDWTLETVVFRILQEALRNVHDHATARSVAVEVVLSARGGIVLRVTDDGVGFDTAADSTESGIEVMRMFASLVGGAIAIESRPDRGTTIEAHLRGDPFDDEPSTPTPEGRPALRVVRGS